MSIHGILAVLLGSTALGGYAPLTLLRAQRYYMIGLRSNSISVHNNNMHYIRAIPKGDFILGEAIHHSMLQQYRFQISWAVQSILFGFTGIMPTVLDFHSLIQETELDGYGYLYGEGYGE